MLDGTEPDGASKINNGPGRVHNFDLQHVSPIIKNKFPLQLQMNFSSMRKQTKMMMQKEPDLTRVETYKLLQYELKQERLKKQQEQEWIAEQERERRERLRHRGEILKQANAATGGLGDEVAKAAGKQVDRQPRKGPKLSKNSGNQ